MKPAIAGFLMLTLNGCVTSQAQLAQEDDAKCRSYGAAPGTDAYVNCRAQADAARRTARAILSAAPD